MGGVNAQDTRCFNPEFPLPPADTRDCTTGAYFIDPKDPNLITVDAKTYGNPAYISKVAPGGLDGKTIQLDVDLIIDVSYLIKKCRFRIKEGVIISMAKDKSLRVDQSHFWACEKMWKGIYVTEGDSFQFFNNKIEDAQYAVRATGKSVLVLQDNIFDRNYIGVYMSPTVFPYMPTGTSGTIARIHPTIKVWARNSFESSAPLNDAFDGQNPMPTLRIGFAGLKIENMPVSLPGTPETVNTFKQLGIGILSLESSLIVTNSCIFKEIMFDGNTKGQLSTQLEKHLDDKSYELGVGILSKKGSLYAQGLSFEDVFYASIFADGTNLNKIANCTISYNPKYNIKLNKNRELFGIRSINNKSAQRIDITRNNINNPRGSETVNLVDVIHDFSAITVDQSSGLNIISYNTIIQADGNCININGAYSDSNPIYIYGNIIKTYSNPYFSLRTTAINLAGSKSFKISNNPINFTYGVGIGLKECSSPLNSRSYVRDNTIKGVSTNQLLILTFGSGTGAIYIYSKSIAINANASPDIDYCNNDLDLTYIGTNFEFNCDNSKLSVTKYHRHNQALRIGAQANNASVLGVQDRQSNEWIANFATQDANMVNAQPQLSLFYIEKGKITYPLFPKKVIVSNSPSMDWFFKDLVNSSSNGCIKPIGAKSEGSPFERDVIDGVAADYLNDVYTWEAERSLVKKAINKNYDEPIDGLEGFLASQMNLNTYTFEHVHQLVADANRFDISVLENLDTEDVANTEAILAIYAANGIDISQTQLAAIQSKLAQLDMNSQKRAKLVKAIEATRLSLLKKALDENYKAKLNTSYAIDEFILNNIEIYNEAFGITDLDDQIMETISVIAAKCPVTDGSNVYRARKMLPICRQTYTDGQCGSVIQSDNELIAGRKVKKSTNVQIYPNPVSNELILNYVAKQIVSDVFIFDALGKQMYHVSPNDNMINLEINTNQWPNGFYFVRIQNAQNEIEVHKFSVIH